jgi:hypothetical protein
MKKEKTYIIDECYRFDRAKDYAPLEHFTIIDEIKDYCKNNKIVIKNIEEIKSFIVFGKKVKIKKDYELLQKELNKNIKVIKK